MSKKQIPLARCVEVYVRLRTWWEKARLVIAEAAKTSAGGELYQLLPGDIGDEVRLRVCGAYGYVRFRHDLENGWLEYGALMLSADGRPVRRARIRDVSFDAMGNVGDHYHFDEQEDDQSFKRLHIRIMAEVVPAMVEMYFSEDEAEEGR